MTIDRRRLLAAGVATGAAALAPRAALAQADAIFAPAPGAWRTFEVITRLEILMPEGATQAWIPLAGMNAPEWFQPKGSEWASNGKASALKSGGADILHVEWMADEQQPYVEIVSRMATRDRAVDLAKPGVVAPLSEAERKLYLSSTDLVPLDTYDVERALAALVELERPVRGVRIDSGDLATISRRVRAHLDAHGLATTIVTASGELDEYRIDELVCGDAPIDRFGVGKQLATPADAPALGAVMKLVEIDGPDCVRRPAKRSPGKVNVAGAKQVLRRFDASGQALGDRVVSRDAPAESDERALLEAVIEGGVRVRPLEPLTTARARAAEELRALPPAVRRLAVPERFPVRFEIEG